MYQEEQEFELNDPRLLADVPDGQSADAEYEQIQPAPPAEGPHWVWLTLREPKEDKPSVYVKGVPGNTKVLARLVPRVETEDGNPGAFAKDYYPSTKPGRGETLGQLYYICQLAGKPVPPGSNNQQIINHVQQVFAAAGENGVRVPAKIVWVRSEMQLDEDGMPVIDAAGRKVYTEIRGEKLIRSLAAAQDIPEDMQHTYVDAAGETRTVQVQIASLLSKRQVEALTK